MAPTAILPESVALCLSAATVGTVHALVGPDHYVPFAALARAGGWSLTKTLCVTTACGLAHVAGSVLLGLFGLGLGLAAMRVETLESLRGDAAAWVLIGFGAAYLTWGVVRAGRAPGSARVRAASDGAVLGHPLAPPAGIRCGRDAASAGPTWSPWLLFLAFAFGPCEPLIPLLMYPAAKASRQAMAAVTIAFAAATIVTMAGAVLGLRSGLALAPGRGLEKYAHALAGAAILACGVLITLGL